MVNFYQLNLNTNGVILLYTSLYQKAKCTLSARSTVPQAAINNEHNADLVFHIHLCTILQQLCYNTWICHPIPLCG